jgi:hypothetical protein
VAVRIYAPGAAGGPHATAGRGRGPAGQTAIQIIRGWAFRLNGPFDSIGSCGIERLSYVGERPARGPIAGENHGITSRGNPLCRRLGGYVAVADAPRGLGNAVLSRFRYADEQQPGGLHGGAAKPVSGRAGQRNVGVR